jgi:hypothetical protein
VSDVLEQISQRYEDFARYEARQRSPGYARITQAIAADPFVLAFLAGLPEAKRQPNLLLAVVRYLSGTREDPVRFLELVRSHTDEIADVMTLRSTQTNEPARCATLLPGARRAAAAFGAAGGGGGRRLCLLPDRYGYDYGHRRIEPTVPSRVIAGPRCSAAVPARARRSPSATSK